MAITTNNLISRQTVGSAGAATVTFSNIPQTFTDLRVVFSVRSDTANNSTQILLQLNSADGSGKVLRGSGAAASSYSDALEMEVGRASGGGSTASVFTNGEFYIPNYASAIAHSISSDVVSENNAATAYAELAANLSTSTAAVTSIRLAPGSDNFTQYSTFSLYGISSSTSTQNTSVPSATGGDVITTDGTYWYHAFKYSGTFTPLKALTADCLVVAGGGGGGGQIGGGGGAGGFLVYTSQSFSSNQTVTIGAGGAGGVLSTSKGVNGSNSQFGSLTASAGGGGGGTRDISALRPGASGGSGGGGTENGAGGAASPSGQGQAGGTSVDGAPAYAGAGGGGASVAGFASSGAGSGAGGNGTSGYSSWGSATSTGQNVSGTYYYAGGGGGGINGPQSGGSPTIGNGGYGGGATAPTTRAVGNNGTANTGGGASGASGSNDGGIGGSGIVIVRYAV